MIEVVSDALLLGISDPLALLALDGDDWIIAAAVIHRASHKHAERRVAELTAVAKNIGAETGNAVGQILARAFRA